LKVSKIKAWSIPAHVPAPLVIIASQAVDEDMETDDKFEELQLAAAWHMLNRVEDNEPLDIPLLVNLSEPLDLDNFGLPANIQLTER